VERLRQWIIIDDYAVSDGFSRTGDRIELAPVLEVADGFIALLDGSLAPDPPTSTWYPGDGWLVMELRGAASQPTGTLSPFCVVVHRAHESTCRVRRTDRGGVRTSLERTRGNFGLCDVGSGAHLRMNIAPWWWRNGAAGLGRVRIRRS